ncbi:MAG: SMC-Scp complex subunit ScpB [Oceanospirillaceae bacterium]|jgi:segregation and condensation protein B|nr:SMC-Scp complex subunit ScpB [Oceanospirillaceae bacterium]MBT4442879.1 SMC-Scp complex subunit ScpB [Oceanospirillaceae bacterium]MBT6076973.1 SMC-Scp complex subunit ScpB [Oceanospirillaceae bacterium]
MISELAPVLEALLLAADKPLSVDRLSQVFDEHDGVDNKRIRSTLRQLQASYDGRGYQLIEVASGFRFQVQQDYALWVARLWQEKPQKYSRALLETLSIIAYQQPITRGEIEAIRGVGVSSPIIHTLLERNWVRGVGHKEVPGRPELFATTKEFLDHFNLKQLSDLPALADLEAWDEATMAPAKLKQPEQQEMEVAAMQVNGEQLH